MLETQRYGSLQVISCRTRTGTTILISWKQLSSSTQKLKPLKVLLISTMHVPKLKSMSIVIMRKLLTQWKRQRDRLTSQVQQIKTWSKTCWWGASSTLRAIVKQGNQWMVATLIRWHAFVIRLWTSQVWKKQSGWATLLPIWLSTTWAREMYKGLMATCKRCRRRRL